MSYFERGNPGSVFVYFISAALCVMFCTDPVVVGISLVCAVATFACLGGSLRLRDNWFYAVIFLLGTALNPIFNHNGSTALFFVNDNPITLEAVVFGAVSSGAVVAVIYWFRAFSLVMTGDRLLYVFGALSPKLALVLSMALRYVPLFGHQAKKIQTAQKTVGAGGGDDLVGRIRSGLRVFWIMVTWTLENGIVTADSMEARGYGSGKRSFFSLYRFRAADGALLGGSLALAAVFFVSLSLGGMDYTFYPELAGAGDIFLSAGGYAACAVLGALPAAIRGGEALKWRYLRSEI